MCHWWRINSPAGPLRSDQGYARRTLVGLPKWLYYVSYVVIFRYASAFLHEQMFRDKDYLVNLPSRNETAQIKCISNNAQYGCR